MSGSAPSVSVLVPCFNKREHVAETLQSVLDQSGCDFELIVVDDGSTDGSVEILRELESRARILLGPNRGASAARQRALEHARGAYIQYLDADDVLLPGALSTRMRALASSGADVAYADWQRLGPSADGRGYERGEVVARRMQDVSPEPDVACFTRFWCPPAALMYTRAVVERIGPWNTSLPVIQDARYLQDAALAGARFVHVPGVTALYRVDDERSLSRRDGLAFARDVFTNAEQVGAIWAARGLDGARRAALADAYDFAARTAFRRDRELFERCVVRLREHDPAGRLRWPRVAASLSRAVGQRGALALLRALGRPAA